MVNLIREWFWKEASKNERNFPLSRSTPVSARVFYHMQEKTLG